MSIPLVSHGTDLLAPQVSRLRKGFITISFRIALTEKLKHIKAASLSLDRLKGSGVLL
jgi:hypothetical protein